MKIAFINPNFAPTRSRDAMQPLVFAVLKSLTPSAYQTVLYDERIEPVPDRPNVDLAALSVQTFTARRAYEIADRLRAQRIPVVLGGIHPTVLPHEAAAHADSVVVGDAEDTWPRLLMDFDKNGLRRIYRSRYTHDLGGLQPDRSIFNGKRYGPLVPVFFRRGCRFACDFCSVGAVYGSTVRHRPVRDVLREIRQLPSGILFFVDDNIFSDKASSLELCRALQPLRRRWICQTGIDLAKDRETLVAMRRSGCRAVFVGFESMSQRTLRAMSKRQNVGVNYTEAVARFREAGIMTCGSFLFGRGEETVRDIECAEGFARRNKLCLSHFNPLFPTPGTPVYERLRSEGRLLYDRWWLHDDYRMNEPIFEPKGMSAKELCAATILARKRFNKLGCILHRLIDPKANSRSAMNVFLYLIANLVSRTEIRRKTGHRLGSIS